MNHAGLDAPRPPAGKIGAVRDSEREILVPWNGPVRLGALVKENRPDEREFGPDDFRGCGLNRRVAHEVSSCIDRTAAPGGALVVVSGFEGIGERSKLLESQPRGSQRESVAL